MIEYPNYIKATFYLFFFIMIFYVLNSAQTFLVPVSLGVLLTFLLMPVSRWLKAHKVPEILAIIMSIILMVLVLGGFLFFLSNQMMSFTDELPQLNDKLGAKFGQIQQIIAEKFNVSEQRQIELMRAQVLNTMKSSGAVLGNIFSATGTFLAAAVLIPIYIFFFTYYRHKFIDFVKHMSSPEKHDMVLHMLRRTSQVSQKYLVGLLIDITILSVLNSIGFLILGINHAILLGVIAGVLNIIPYIGVMIGSIFPFVMALLTKDSIWVAFGALGVCGFVQFLDNNFITPKVVGSAVSINPLATMLALLIGGSVWGVAGMMLFIPFLGMLKVILDNVEHLRPYGFLIGEETKFNPKKKSIFSKKEKAIKLN